LTESFAEGAHDRAKEAIVVEIDHATEHELRTNLLFRFILKQWVKLGAAAAASGALRTWSIGRFRGLSMIWICRSLSVPHIVLGCFGGLSLASSYPGWPAW